MARPRCPICRSRRWHRDRQSGLVVCEEGHILQGYRQEDNEAEGPSQHAVIRRKLRKNKEKRVRRTADPDIFHGTRLRFLYYQCAQIILRKQIAAIIEAWKLPAEVETIARDLWAMYVTLTNLEAEPFKDGEEEHSEPSSPEKAAHNDPDPIQKIYDALSESEDEGMPPSASRGFGKWNADTQDEEVNAIDSAPNDSDEDEDNLNIKDSRRSRKHTAPSQAFNPAARLRLQYSLVICYLSCLTLRIPILMKDMLDLAESYKLDYLEALQAIPSDMRKHLNLALTDLELVQNHVLPIIGDESTSTHLSFAPLVNAFARMLHTNYSVTFPDINPAPILYKTVRDLGLPPFIYLVARRVLIDLGSTLSLSIAKGTKLREFPDLTLAAAIVFTLKLLWGLDGTSRIPQGPDDMISALPRLNEWLDFSESIQNQFPTTSIPVAAMSQDVTSLKTEEVDDFLSFFQERLLVDDHKTETILGSLPIPRSGAKMVDRFFPVHPLPTPSSMNNEDQTTETKREEAIRHFYAHVSMPIPNEASSEEPLFPGQQYRIYDTRRDHDGTLPEDYQRVLQLLSKVTGIQLSVIESAVYKMEVEFMKKEMGWKVERTQFDQLPLQGIETRMYGRMREKGGMTPWPKEIQASAKLARPEKEKALLAPKMLV